MINVRIPNLKKLQKALLTHKVLFVREFQKAIAKAGFKVEAESKKVTPVDTGRLRASIRTDVGFLQAIVMPHTNYALYVHEGTYRMSKRPFMEWGVEKANVIQLFLEAEDRVLRKIALKTKI